MSYLAGVLAPSLEHFNSIFLFWVLMKFEDFDHGLAWVKVEHELLIILLSVIFTLGGFGLQRGQFSHSLVGPCFGVSPNFVFHGRRGFFNARSTTSF